MIDFTVYTREQQEKIAQEAIKKGEKPEIVEQHLDQYRWLVRTLAKIGDFE